MLTNDTCLFPFSFVNMSLSCTAGEECRVDCRLGGGSQSHFQSDCRLGQPEPLGGGSQSDCRLGQG